MLTAHLEARFFHDSSIWPFSRKKARADNALTCCFLVAPTGFEPATSALRGRRPKPLDDGAISASCEKWLGWKESNPHIRHQKPLSCH